MPEGLQGKEGLRGSPLLTLTPEMLLPFIPAATARGKAGPVEYRLCGHEGAPWPFTAPADPRRSPSPGRGYFSSVRAFVFFSTCPGPPSTIRKIFFLVPT